MKSRNLSYILIILVLCSALGLGRQRRLNHKRGHENKERVPVPSSTEQIPDSNSWQSDDDGGYMSSQDICDSWYCGMGQECRPGSDSLPTCVCKEECASGQGQGSMAQKPSKGMMPPPPAWDSKFESGEPDQGSVCGTDGIVYPSECELHRSGCLTANTHLQVLGGPEICQEGDVEDESVYEDEGKGQPDELPGPEVMQPQPYPRPGQSPQNHGHKGNRPGLPLPKSDGDSKHGPRDDGMIPEEKYDDNNYEDDYPMEDETLDEDEDDYSSLKKMRKSIKKMGPKSGPASEMGKQFPKTKRGSTLCTSSEYKIFKKALLNYNLKHLLPHSHPHPHPISRLSHSRREEQEKEKLISEMFGHFDQNHDGFLDYAELQKIGFEESLGEALLRCHPVDFLHHDDVDRDGRLNPNEFETAFTTFTTPDNVSPTIKTPTRDTTDTGGGGQGRRKVIRVKGKVGESLELKCPTVSSSRSTFSSASSSPVLVEWKRFGRPLEGSAVGIVSGVTLSIPKLELVHAGNFSCGRGDDADEEHFFQVIVTSAPKVRVFPHMILERPGADIKLECRVQGEPLPSIRWLKNDAPLSPLLVEAGKYSLTGPFLEVKSVGVSDTGAYLCEGNAAGSGMDIASLLVVEEYISLPSDVKPESTNESLFVLLHDRGISMYDPNNCRLHQEILGSDIIPGTQDLICDSHPCAWGSGVLVPPSYIYAAQPNLDRILVISLSEMVVVDVISTVHSPKILHHVPQTDQVWIHGQSGVQVVSDAGKKKKHGSARSIDEDEVGQVRSMFLPSTSPFLAGYLTKQGVRGMYKIDLKTGNYLKSVDLSGFNCLPEDAHFSSLYGFVILECREPVLGRPTGTILLDSLTDAVVGHHPQLQGHSFLSPDNHWLVTLSPRKTKKHKPATDFVVHEVTRNGLEHRYTVRSSINASSLAFFPSQRVQSYDIFATSTNEAHPHLIFIDLSSGRTELVQGVGRSNHLHQRSITGQSGQFGHFLVTPGSHSAFVINGRTRTVNCQIGGAPLNNISSTLWLQTTSI